MRVEQHFRDLRYTGFAEGDRKEYYIFQGARHFLVVSPSGPTSYTAAVVPSESAKVIKRRFAGKRVTAKEIKTSSKRPDLFGAPFAGLNALYVMVALGQARKLKLRDGKAMVFKVR